jgi:four helix bundle protein
MVEIGSISTERQSQVTKMNKAKTFKDLTVWQKSHEFVLKIYKLTRIFPSYELFGLTSQIRRSAVSIPANIVEGFKRKGKANKLRFLNISQASLEEMRYYLILANDLEYENTEELQEGLDEVSRMLDGYVRSFDA